MPASDGKNRWVRRWRDEMARTSQRDLEVLCAPAVDDASRQRRSVFPRRPRAPSRERSPVSDSRTRGGHGLGTVYRSRTGSNEPFGASQGRFLPEDRRSREIDTVGVVGSRLAASSRPESSADSHFCSGRRPRSSSSERTPAALKRRASSSRASFATTAHS